MPTGQKPHFHHLKNKWSAREKHLIEGLWARHGQVLNWAVNNFKHFATGTAAGFMILTHPFQISLPTPQILNQHHIGAPLDKTSSLLIELSSKVPKEVRKLTPDEEKEITEVLSRNLGFNVTAEIDGKRLNRSYGLIGAEQHLARYPGDTMESHFDSQEEAREFYSSGMAPGLGAWRYFAPSASGMSEKDKMREKYYIAVQTFLSEGFSERFAEYRDFYKYRKMLLVNPNNGKAIVTVIGDAGPAEWTGKHLGGSPEVMKYLERVDGRGRGPVLYFFIDDPNDTISLGPVTGTQQFAKAE